MVDGVQPKLLSMKELVKVAGLFAGIMTALMTALTWIHAEMTIPQILIETQKVIERSIDRHVSTGIHPDVLGEDEFIRWVTQHEKSVETFNDRVLDELEKIQDELKSR